VRVFTSKPQCQASQVFNGAEVIKALTAYCGQAGLNTGAKRG
jgi:hypothetical protein